MTMLSVDAQIRYLVQWFNEWSDLQRSDFLPIIAEKFAEKAYMNGIVNNMSNINCEDKPMSLFQCRVKLFKEWIVQWNAENRENFLKQLGDIDPIFIEKLTEELKKELQVNGTHEVYNDQEEVLED